MYFAVMKVTLEVTTPEFPTRKDLTALVEKIRGKHRVACMVVSSLEDEGTPAIAVAGLANSEESLSRQLDSIVNLCEEAGLGRVESENTLLDHLDSFADTEEDDD